MTMDPQPAPSTAAATPPLPEPGGAALFRLFLEHAPAALAMFDREMRYLCASRRWRDDFGLGDRELEGRSHYEVFPESPEAWREAQRRGLAGEVVRAAAERFVRADGSEHWVRWEIHPWRDEARRVGGIVLFSEDVTEVHLAQQRCAESEMQLRAILDSMASFVALLDLDGRVLQLNRAPLAAAGLRADEVIGQHAAHTFFTSHSLAVQAQIGEAIRRAAAGETVHETFTARVAEGAVTLAGSFVPLRDPSGEVMLIVASAVDVSEQRLAEESLRDAAERLQWVIEGTETGLWEWDIRTDHVRYSREWKRQLGLAEDEVRDDFGEWLRLAHPDDVEPVLRAVQSFLAAPHGVLECEFRLRHADGGYRWILSRSALRAGPDGEPATLLGMHLDISERKHVEAALRESGERLQTLSRRLLATQEEERRRLARELHDGLGQSLTAARLHLLALDGRAGTARRDALAAVERSLEEVRRIALDLRPAVLDDVGLAAAVRWLADRQARAGGLAVEVRVDDGLADLAPDVETACFRIAQEATNNVVRHARARTLRVELRQAAAGLELAVSDDGVGFDPAVTRRRAMAASSLGLLGMEERAALLGGSLEVGSRPGAGTCVRARLPLGAQPASRSGA